MAKNYYAIKRGFDKKDNKKVTDLILDDWSVAGPLVKGYNDARYKGFDTKEEAEVWLSVVDKTDAEKRAKKELDKVKAEVGIDKDVNQITNDYIDMLDKLIEDYKKEGCTRISAIGNLTYVLVNEVDKIYGGIV